MPRPKPLGKELILAAMAKTKSNMAAARYLNVSYQHYKKWAKLYESDTHENLFFQHKNQSGKGIPKFLRVGGKEPALLDLIEEECAQCGFQERRVLDYKIPILLHFKDGNKKNYHLNNLEMLCYNHFFLTVGDIFSNKQIEGIEDHKPVNQGKVEWEVDDYHLERLKELGLDSDDKDELDIISRI